MSLAFIRFGWKGVDGGLDLRKAVIDDEDVEYTIEI
jgi:hypothetical protein